MCNVASVTAFSLLHCLRGGLIFVIDNNNTCIMFTDVTVDMHLGGHDNIW